MQLFNNFSFTHWSFTSECELYNDNQGEGASTQWYQVMHVCVKFLSCTLIKRFFNVIKYGTCSTNMDLRLTFWSITV